MYCKRTFCLIAIFLLLAPAAWAKGNIYILATGGTITGKQASKDQPGYQAGSLDSDWDVRFLYQHPLLLNSMFDPHFLVHYN